MTRCWGLPAFALLGLVACGEAAPYFASVFVPEGEAPQLAGPLWFEAAVVAAAGVQTVEVHVLIVPGPSDFLRQSMVSDGVGGDAAGQFGLGETYRLALAAPQSGQSLLFYLSARDRQGVEVRAPEGAPDQLFRVDIVP